MYKEEKEFIQTLNDSNILAYSFEWQLVRDGNVPDLKYINASMLLTMNLNILFSNQRS